jgi:hypothetical protein
MFMVVWLIWVITIANFTFLISVVIDYLHQSWEHYSWLPYRYFNLTKCFNKSFIFSQHLLWYVISGSQIHSQSCHPTLQVWICHVVKFVKYDDMVICNGVTLMPDFMGIHKQIKKFKQGGMQQPGTVGKGGGSVCVCVCVCVFLHVQTHRPRWFHKPSLFPEGKIIG